MNAAPKCRNTCLLHGTETHKQTLNFFTSSDGPAGGMQQAIINTQKAFYRQLLLFPTPPVHVHP